MRNLRRKENGMKLVRWAIAFLLAAVAMAVPTAADPVSPPSPAKLRAWVLEFAGGRAKPLNSEITWKPVTGVDGPMFYAIVPYTGRGAKRAVGHSAAVNGPYEDGRTWPSAWKDGSELTSDACPAAPSAVCAAEQKELTQPPSIRIEQTGKPTTFSFYVVAQNLDIASVGRSAGWRPIRPVAPSPVRTARDTGTGARLGKYAVEQFRHAAAPGGKHGILAWAWLPCFANMGKGEAELTGGQVSRINNDSYFRRPGCDQNRAHIGMGWSDTRTAWSLDGDVVGWARWPVTLTVIDLPA